MKHWLKWHNAERWAAVITIVLMAWALIYQGQELGTQKEALSVQRLELDTAKEELRVQGTELETQKNALAVQEKQLENAERYFLAEGPIITASLAFWRQAQPSEGENGIPQLVAQIDDQGSSKGWGSSVTLYTANHESSPRFFLELTVTNVGRNAGVVQTIMGMSVSKSMLRAGSPRLEGWICGSSVRILTTTFEMPRELCA